jgi:RimK family alpha-L-glutamate ligase
MRRLAIVGSPMSPTNRRLLEAARALGLDAFVLPAREAARSLEAGDIALGRLDVLSTLDGPEPGLAALRALEDRGVHVLNRAASVVAAHDKLVTAIKLATRGLPHPRTAHVGAVTELDLAFPVIVKPRFGSWGRDVVVARDRAELERHVSALGPIAWFRRHGALVQELVPPQGYDLRIVVAAGEVVGAVKRLAADGEWRTNIALGGRRETVDPPPQARLVALGAVAALGMDLVGVDLLPDGDGGWVVLELNGAVDFTPEYGLGGANVFARVVETLVRAVGSRFDLPEEDVGELSFARTRRIAPQAGPDSRLALEGVGSLAPHLSFTRARACARGGAAPGPPRSFSDSQ